jgi:hypothetical protein
MPRSALDLATGRLYTTGGTMATQPRRRGFTPEERAKHSDDLIAWVAEGGMVREFCRQKGRPGWNLVYEWIHADDDLRRRFARARDLGSEAVAQEALAIADTPEKGVTVTEDSEGTKTVTEDMLGHRRLQVETRLKLLARWNPRKWGDGAQHGQGEPLRVQLPPINSAADIPAAYAVVAEALRSGSIDATEAATLQRLLDGYRASFGEAELERKFRELEARLAERT